MILQTLKTMLVKYKLGYLVMGIAMNLSLKTMLVKYK